MYSKVSFIVILHLTCATIEATNGCGSVSGMNKEMTESPAASVVVARTGKIVKRILIEFGSLNFDHIGYIK